MAGRMRQTHAQERPQDSANEGSTPRLGVALRQRHVTMISLGGIIGAGLFVGSSATLNTVGPAACLSYLVAGIVVLMVMRMLGEMALAVPGIGSFTEYARIGLGDWAGFTSGWLYWYFWVIVVAVEAVAGAAILQRWIPAPVWMIGLVLLSVMTFINLMSVKSYGEFEFWFASIKVAAIIVFIAIGAAWVFGFGHTHSAWSNLTASKGFLPFGTMSVFAAVPTVIFAVGGAEIATIAAAESDNPAKSVAAMTRSVILRVITFYVGSMFLIACIVPWTSIVTGHSPFVSALETMRVPGAADIMNAIVLVAVLSALNSGLYVSSRILFRLAGRGDAPRALLRLTPSRVPRLAVLLSSVVGYVAIIAAIVSPQGVFLFLVNASGAVMLFVYLATALAQIRIRRRLERKGVQPELPMWLFPWLSYAVVAAIVGVLIAMGTDAGLRPQLMASIASLAVASAAWLLAARRRHADEGTRTGYLASIERHAMQGDR
ncbi:amino acid permease [Paraburkholderia phenoliruptrix]|uniref:Amino acid transporter, AAT family n=2 Tax=Paraburkholderia phenoliruptrix TaxID=252970 RepID=K0DZ09_9BURK|nr:amino acid permease [Paraburkholderia phenoliruptrix]AFT88674.1 amino acid transporter, AAT family [Paraburkholderia phenoliruptrix BR3459a]CAB4047610.1 GABA permease [Paraburkholderia phenoliruptrix]